MNITTIHLVYFSPTGTTHATLREVAAELGGQVREYDLTRPEAREKVLSFGPEDLVLLGMPVYYGRIPALFHEYARLRGERTPVVPVVVYGNRAYEDALKELTDIASWNGFVPVAAGAFIVQHSLNPEMGAGRPDPADKTAMRAFGREIARKLAAVSGVEELQPLPVKGQTPYKAYGRTAFVPGVDAQTCTDCGACVDACPVAIIEDAQFTVTTPDACIGCLACVKICPVQARAFAPEETALFSQRMQALARTCAERKEPETWL